MRNSLTQNEILPHYDFKQTKRSDEANIFFFRAVDHTNVNVKLSKRGNYGYF